METKIDIVLCALAVLTSASSFRGQDTAVPQTSTPTLHLTQAGLANHSLNGHTELHPATSTEKPSHHSASISPTSSSHHISVFPSLKKRTKDSRNNTTTVPPFTNHQTMSWDSPATPHREAYSSPVATSTSYTPSPLTSSAISKDSAHVPVGDFSTPTVLTQTALFITSVPTYPNVATSLLTSALTRSHADVPSELNVGDDAPVLLRSKPPLDPLLAGLLSVFIVIVAIVSLFIFIKFRNNGRPEFHRLQDLPMDDMMEDTPLSRFNY